MEKPPGLYRSRRSSLGAKTDLLVELPVVRAVAEVGIQARISMVVSVASRALAIASPNMVQSRLVRRRLLWRRIFGAG